MPRQHRIAHLIAGATFKDTSRRRGSWTTTLLTGALFALLVVGGGAVNERMQERAEGITFRVAISGDPRGAEKFLDQVRTSRLRVDRSYDAATDVAESRAAVGMKMPNRVDELIARREPFEIPIYYRGGSNTSREAYNTLLLRLQELQLEMVDAPIDVGPEVTIEQRQVRRDERVNRLQFSRTLSALTAILCMGVISSVSSVLGRGRERRSIEPLLLLPASRETVVAGTAAGTLPVAILQLYAAVSLLIAGSMIPVIGLNLAPGSLPAIAVTSLVGVMLLGALACATGCLAGVLGTGSDDAVSLGDFMALPFVGVGVLLFLQPSVTSSALSFGIPILGQALFLRDGVSGDLSLLNGAVAIASTALWCYLLLRFAARRLDGERAIVRGTN